MDTVECDVPMAELVAEVLSIPLVRIPNGAGHGHFGTKSGWIRGLSNARIRSGPTYPLTSRAVTLLGSRVGHYDVRQILVNKMDPGAELAPHRDGAPQYDRYHLPIVTNNDAYWWDEHNGHVAMRAGTWYGPVPYCGILHSAGNPGRSDRIHLIVDFGHMKG